MEHNLERNLLWSDIVRFEDHVHSINDGLVSCTELRTIRHWTIQSQYN